MQVLDIANLAMDSLSTRTELRIEASMHTNQTTIEAEVLLHIHHHDPVINNSQESVLVEISKNSNPMSNCRISNMISPEKDGYSSYQSIYYFTHDLDVSAALNVSNIEWNCDNFNRSNDRLLVKMKNGTKVIIEDIICNQDNDMRWGKPPRENCPVSNDDIDAASSLLQNWPLKIAAFCNLKNLATAAIEDPVRIITIGGSEAQAAYVQMQCCIIMQPANFMKCAQWERDKSSYIKENEYYCSWTGYFAR